MTEDELNDIHFDYLLMIPTFGIDKDYKKFELGD